MSDSKPPGDGITRLPQDRETPLSSVEMPFGTALTLYSRSVDSITGETIGQDYVAYRHDGNRLAFAVCDGVGQSFMGDLAARLLGDWLVRWLWDLERPANAEAFARGVKEALNSAVSDTAPQVVNYKLPAGLPPILAQALENQRKYGSESMFVAGKLYLAQPGAWAALCWLGDSPVAAVDIDGQLVDLGPRGHTSERWNATTGIKGEAHTWMSDAHALARVAGYTDGLGIEGVPRDEDLRRIMEGWTSSPPIDDAALFDVRLAPSPQTTGQTGRLLLPERVPQREKHPEPESKPAAPTSITDSRPIVVPEELKQGPGPVKGVERIEPSTAQGAVGSWRPLKEEKAPASAAPSPLEQLGLPTELSVDELQALQKIGELAELDSRDQVRMWQQAAMLGLTSAALALLMIERLLKQSEEGGQTDG